MKKLIALLLIFTIVMTVGCGKTESTDGESVQVKNDKSQQAAGDEGEEAEAEEAEAEEPIEKVTVRMMYWNKEETVDTLLAFLAEELPDVEVEYQFVENGTYNNILQTQLAAGEGPDIFGGGDPNLFTQGLIEDLSQFGDRYSEAGKALYSVDGALFAIPGISWFEGIYYNKTIFEENGLSVPTTFEEELELHRQLKELGYIPQAMGAKSWEPMLKSSLGYVMNDYLFTEEGKDFDVLFGKGEVTLSGNWNDSIKEWARLIEDGYITQDMLGIDYDQALNQFASGEAAMWESGPWSLETIKQANPDLEFDMFPFYGNEPGGKGYLIGGPGVGFCVNANSAQKEAAMRVIDAISTPEGQRAFWEDNQGGSSFLIGMDLPMPKEFEGVKETMMAGNVYVPWNIWGLQGLGVNSIISDYGKYFQEVLAGNATIDEALEALDRRAAEIIETNKD